MHRFSPLRFTAVIGLVIAALMAASFQWTPEHAIAGFLGLSAVVYGLNVSPVMSANAFGTLSGVKILQRALELVFTRRPILKNITLGLEDLDGGMKDVKLGQQVITRTRSIPTVQAFGTGAQDLTATDVPVTLSLERELHVQFTRAEYNSTSRDLIDEAAEPIAVAIGNYFVDQIAALWIAANFPTSTIVASGWNYTNTLVVLQGKLDGRGVSGLKRFLAHSVAVGSSFQGDTMIVTELNNARNAGAIQTGELPVVAGFGLEKYPALPNTGNMVGFAGTPDSTLLAVRPHANPEEVAGGAIKFPGVFGHVTGPHGLTLAVSQWIDPSTLAINSRLSWMQGTAKGNANNGEILKTA